jgi:hypothetical protein
MIGRVKRRLHNLLAAGSLMMCIAMTLLWTDSYFGEMAVVHCSSSSRLVIACSKGDVIAASIKRPEKPGFYFVAGAPISYWQNLPTAMGSRWFGLALLSAPLNGVICSCWVLVLVTAAPPFIAWIRKRPTPDGACPVCGYDLRATPTRCPECGTTSAAALRSKFIS